MSEFIFTQVIEGVREIVEREELFLKSLDGKTISSKFNVQNRSIKQIVGHMIDSASNNLHRFIHLQYNETPLVFPNYSTGGNNDRWIAIQNFQEEDWDLLVQLWKYSNLHIIHVIKHIDLNRIDCKWIASPGEEVTLKDMVIDYLRHLELHIREIHQLYES